ncbi:MAG: hypothetical protein LBG79_07860 [Spirochaetaceae bacterium]|jgi:hypothetical protein|nr:hypothetical protein [Spirochaetaceae bacterium]
MEELKSTESLDREIEADAQNKAAKIKKNAAANIEKSRNEWHERLKAALEKESAHFAARLSSKKLESGARLNLDKKRLKDELSARWLKEGAANFLIEYPREELLAALSRLFTSRVKSAFFNDFSALSTCIPVVFYQNLSKDELFLILNAVFSDCGLELASWKFEAQESQNGRSWPCLTLETDDIRINASISDEADGMLLEKRAEFVHALET